MGTEGDFYFLPGLDATNQNQTNFFNPWKLNHVVRHEMESLFYSCIDNASHNFDVCSVPPSPVSYNFPSFGPEIGYSFPLFKNCLLEKCYFKMFCSPYQFPPKLNIYQVKKKKNVRHSTGDNR